MVIREVYRQGPYRITREYLSEEGSFFRVKKLARTEFMMNGDIKDLVYWIRRRIRQEGRQAKLGFLSFWNRKAS